MPAPRRWNLSLTYPPKIPRVTDGTISQTIRVGRKLSVGDLVSFHGWEGAPYRSKWSFRTPYFPLSAVIPIRILPGGIEAFCGDSIEYRAWTALDRLAELDGIIPSTGEALRDVLMSMHRIPEEGIEAQIIRWIGPRI